MVLNNLTIPPFVRQDYPSLLQQKRHVLSPDFKQKNNENLAWNSKSS